MFDVPCYAFRKSLGYLGWTRQTGVGVVLTVPGLVGLYLTAGRDFALEELYAYVALVIGPGLAWAALVFLYALVRAPASLRQRKAALDLAEAMNTGVAQTVRNSLSLALRDPGLRVSRAGLFGSLAHGREAKDVDLLVVLDCANDKQVRQSYQGLRQLSRQVKERSTKPLHVQAFLKDEEAKLGTFVDTAGKVEWVVGDDDG